VIKDQGGIKGVKEKFSLKKRKEKMRLQQNWQIHENSDQFEFNGDKNF
jgi:hypothetical protein